MTDMLKNNEANREKLATAVVDGLDLDTLVSFAIEALQNIYADCDASFKADWENCFHEIQPEEEEYKC